MNSYFQLKVVALSFVSTTCISVAEEVDERLIPIVSPSGFFNCLILKGKDGTGNDVVLKNIQSGDELVVHKSLRWVETAWSPDSRWLVVTDHWDGHGSNIRFFFVVGRASDSLVWEVPKIYATPWPTQYNCKWKFVKWELAEGCAEIECNYKSQAAEGSVVVKTYKIPLDYP